MRYGLFGDLSRRLGARLFVCSVDDPGQAGGATHQAARRGAPLGLPPLLAAPCATRESTKLMRRLWWPPSRRAYRRAMEQRARSSSTFTCGKGRPRWGFSRQLLCTFHVYMFVSDTSNQLIRQHV